MGGREEGKGGERGNREGRGKREVRAGIAPWLLGGIDALDASEGQKYSAFGLTSL